MFITNVVIKGGVEKHLIWKWIREIWVQINAEILLLGPPIISSYDKLMAYILTDLSTSMFYLFFIKNSIRLCAIFRCTAGGFE